MKETSPKNQLIYNFAKGRLLVRSRVHSNLSAKSNVPVLKNSSFFSCLTLNAHHSNNFGNCFQKGIIAQDITTTV